MKPDVLLVEDVFARMPIMEALAPHFTVHLLPDQGDRRAVVAAVATRIRAIATSTLVGADAALIGALPNLEIIACAGGHVHKIDRAAARARGVPVTNTPNLSTEDVADLVIALLLAVARQVGVGDRFVRGGRWFAGSSVLGTKVTGKKLGIVGLGRIGREVADRAAGFRLEIAYHGPRPKADVPYRYCRDLVEMARAVDFLAVTCRSHPETRHLVGRAVLAALGAGGFLVNVTQGVVDEAALVDSLRGRKIAGAAMDAFAIEPEVPEELLALENVVLTPHMGSATAETRRAMADITVANLRAHFAGGPLLNPVP